jgi:hypothetical protein
VEYTIGPVYGGTFTWTTPALTRVPPTGNGFLGVTTFQGKFVAVERNGVASTSTDGATWVGRALPGPNGGANRALIAAGPNRVAIIGQGVAWTSSDGEAWTAASTPPLGPAQPTAIAPRVDGFVAIGTAPGGRRAAAWMSADGSSWVSSPDQSAFEHFCPTAVATGPTGRVVAVGDDCYPNLARPTAAISDDGGLTWRRAPAQTQLSEEGRLTAVVAGGPGFIAVGAIIRDVYPGWPPGTAMFASADGLSWRRVGYFESGVGRLGPFLEAIPGGYLAIDTGDEKPSAFVSVDGVRWTRSAALPATPHAFDNDYSDTNRGFAVNGNRMVGVGTADNTYIDRPGAFTVLGALTPGPAWTGRIPLPPVVPTPRQPTIPVEPPFPGKVTWAVESLPINVPPGAVVLNSYSFDVTRWRGGFVAVGSVAFRGASIQARAVVWTSPDGARWTEHPLPPDCDNGGEIAATRTTIVVAGNGGICRSTDARAWTRITDIPHQIKGLTGIIAGGPGFILTMAYPTSTTVSVKVWRSVDGRQWRTAGHPAAFSNLAPQAVASGPRGIVVLGQRYTNALGWTVVPLRSRDGITWSRGVRQRAFEPDAFSTTAASMISGGPGYIAAGSYQPRSRTGAAVWTSSDGLAWKRTRFVLPASGYVEFDGLARIGPGYAVVGILAPPSQEGVLPTVWLSPDGTRWRSGISLPFPADGPVDWVDITGVAGGTARLVAVGNRYGGSSQAAVWTGTYAGPTRAGS